MYSKALQFTDEKGKLGRKDKEKNRNRKVEDRGRAGAVWNEKENGHPAKRGRENREAKG
jgi:hypothetical protein